MRVVLVNLPFQPLQFPSTGVGYIAAAVHKAGHTIRVADLNYPLADFILERAPALEKDWENRHPAHLGQLVFSILAFPENLEDSAQLQLIVRWAESDHDLEFEDLFEEISEFLNNWVKTQRFQETDVIGISLMNYQLLPAIYLIKTIRKIAPHSKIVIGGFYCSLENGIRLMQLFPEIDFCVHGEGEKTFTKLLAEWSEGRSGNDVSGIVFRPLDGEPRANTATPLMNGSELDALAFPDYDWIPTEAWEKYDINVPLVSIRGCYWGKCTYCSDFRFNKSTFARSPESVIAEMESQARRYGREKFYFSDLASNDSINRINRICEGLIESRFSYSFTILLKPDNIDLPMLQNLKRAGCVAVQYGIESLSNNLLRKMAKGCTSIDNVRAIKLTELAGMQALSNIIKFYPTETLEEVLENYEKISKYPELFNGFVFGFPVPFKARAGASAMKLIGRTSPFHVIERAIHHHYFPKDLADEIPDIEWSVDPDSTHLASRMCLWDKIGSQLRDNMQYRNLTSYRDEGEKLILKKANPRNGRITEYQLVSVSRRVYLMMEDKVGIENLRQDSGLDEETLDDLLEYFEEEGLIFRDGDMVIASIASNVQDTKLDPLIATVENKMTKDVST